MTNIFKKISWLVLGVMITITAVAYICPMAMPGGSMAKSSISNLCQSVGLVSSNMDGMVSCMGAHLAAAGQLLGNVPQVINFVLALILLAVVFRSFYRNLLAVFIRPLLSRLRHRYFCYHTSIKFLIEKKLLEYLNFIGSDTIVSLA